MKTLYFLLYLLSPDLSFCQDLGLRKSIDSNILAINHNSAKISSFIKTENINEHNTTIRYHFKMVNGRLNYISREYSNKDSSVKQNFYLSVSQLIYSTESITNYYAKDSIHWKGTYYFQNSKLRDYETLGHGKSEIDTWNPEAEVLKNYQRARSAVQTYLKK
jgi:hypothetical protein